MFYKDILNNGLRILIEPMENVRSITVGVWIKSGSRFESEKTQGISHLLEHMLFKGTDKMSARDIAERVDSIGGHMNAFTSKEYTCIYLKVIDTHFDIALDILSDMYFNSKFTEEELKKEKQVILEEIKMYEDTPDEYVHDLVLEGSYEGHELAHNILGDRKSVNDILLDDLNDHYNTYFTADKTVVSVSGNIDRSQAVSSIAKYFNVFKEKNSQSNDSLSIPNFKQNNILKTKDTEQIHKCIAFSSLHVNDERLYQLNLLNNIIGGGMSSKLFQELREERGLCYAVFSYYLNFLDSGLFIIYAGVAEDNYYESCDLIWEILNNVKNGDITKEELERSKEQVKGNILMGLESTSNRMARLGRDELIKEKILTTDEIIQKIDQTTENDLVKLADDIFNKDNMSNAVIGPVSEIYQLK
ncbi:M16 family metallopeptidase [Natranaerobius trueperi]|uniref:Peptidase M16 n=1 Tax=Natranaerobius trueperi TaxID=759412 RepID=A0A226BZC3_9FIRM|nr:pitrilysin family protein [Natranaerobius trueperi]OWZ84285.1 peptidase M16 [Natranaerobius trueperi]